MNNTNYGEFIRKYNIIVKVINGEERIGTYDKTISKKPEALNFMKNNKQELIAYIREEEENEIKKAKERKAKIKAIEGLDEIERLESDWNDYHADFEKSMESESGMRKVLKPEITVGELCKKYPRAAAYRKAEGYAHASNHNKSAAGQKALERIINGENYELVISEMESEWKKATMEHMWD